MLLNIELQGIEDIVKVLESGYNKTYPISREKADAALVLMLVTILLIRYYKKIRVLKSTVGGFYLQCFFTKVA